MPVPHATVTGHHPDLNLEPSADRYVSYWENMVGEQWVFVAERGKPGKLTGVDVDWKVYDVTDDGMGRPVVSGGLIIDGAERTWLTACWEGSTLVRTGTLATPELDVEALGREFGRRHWTSAFDQWPTSKTYRGAMNALNFIMGRRTVELGLSPHQLEAFIEAVYAGLEEAGAASDR
jgi:hypothetical protein